MLHVACYMLFNVPQFIDIEDKIVGPLTARQLGWLGACGVVLLILWSFFDMQTFIMGAIIAVPIALALAFYRPYNQPLIKFINSSISFTIRPKIYIWRRLPERIGPIAKSEKAKESIIPKKTIQSKKIEEVSKLLDQK